MHNFRPSLFIKTTLDNPNFLWWWFMWETLKEKSPDMRACLFWLKKIYAISLDLTRTLTRPAKSLKNLQKKKSYTSALQPIGNTHIWKQDEFKNVKFFVSAKLWISTSATLIRSLTFGYTPRPCWAVSLQRDIRHDKVCRTPSLTANKAHASIHL